MEKPIVTILLIDFALPIIELTAKLTIREEALSIKQKLSKSAKNEALANMLKIPKLLVLYFILALS